MVTRFEDLHAWKKAKRLAVDIYRLTGEEPFSRDWGIRDQMRRASVSIMANVAEGFGRSSRKDFAHFLVMARASCVELSSHSYLCEEIGYLDRSVTTSLRKQTDEVARIIGGLRQSLKSPAKKRDKEK